MSYFAHHLGELGAETLTHIGLVAVSLFIGLAIAMPLGVLAARNAHIRTPLFGLLSVIYVVPSLAVLAILVQYIGLGPLPVIVVLAAYAQFILVRSIATALRGVPFAATDAARGLGMSSRQQFWRVELPLAAPVMIGGLRLATVALIAIATLGGYVGAGGLGVHIFLGLQRQYVAETLAGSIPAAVLAIFADALFRGLERMVTRRVSG